MRPYCAAQGTLPSVAANMGRKSKTEWVHAYVQPVHFAVQLKLTQHCKSTMCCAKSLSRVQLFATLWTVARQAPLSMGFLQARTLEWVAMPSSRGSSQPRGWTQVSNKINFKESKIVYDPAHPLKPSNSFPLSLKMKSNSWLWSMTPLQHVPTSARPRHPYSFHPVLLSVPPSLGSLHLLFPEPALVWNLTLRPRMLDAWHTVATPKISAEWINPQSWLLGMLPPPEEQPDRFHGLVTLCSCVSAGTHPYEGEAAISTPFAPCLRGTGGIGRERPDCPNGYMKACVFSEPIHSHELGK